MKTPARRLKGLVLNDKWHVEDRFELAHNATGGFFSVGYKVKTKSGTLGFLKALDYEAAMRGHDPATILEAMTQAFNFEREVLRRCGERRLTRVIRAIEDGTAQIELDGKSHTIQYIVFELADGDIRKHLETLRHFDLIWVLKSLHHTATGLRQLHGEGIAHQDLKPSNVMVFDNSNLKVGDLGRSSLLGLSSPHDDHIIPGDQHYAPPEQLYGHLPSEWAIRRLGCDAYQLGSLIVFFFTGVSMTTAWLKRLDLGHWPGKWGGSFQDVLPYLRQSFGLAISDIEQEMKNLLGDVALGVQRDILTLVRELCEPDPNQRCNYASRASGKLLLERYVARFDLLAKKAEFELKKR